MMLLFLWLMFGIAAALAAARKGRSPLGWFFLGVLLGPFALLFALLSSSKPASDPAPASSPSAPVDALEATKICPACAETIKLAATKCRFCGQHFDPDQVAGQLAALEADLAAHQGRIRCPHCRSWDVYPYAVLPDGGHGPWCPHCQKPV